MVEVAGSSTNLISSYPKANGSAGIPGNSPKVDPPAQNLNETPTDTYTGTQNENSSGGWLGRTLVTAIGVGGLFIAGRKGVFGKTIKSWLGGVKASESVNVIDNIEERLMRYIERTENTPFKIRQLAHGKITAGRTLENGNRELISFNASSGAPERRVVFTKNNKATKELAYQSYKGCDILDKGFDEVSNVCKKLVRSPLENVFMKGSQIKENITKIYYNNFDPYPRVIKFLSRYSVASKTSPRAGKVVLTGRTKAVVARVDKMSLNKPNSPQTKV